jgi:NADH-quinone oxidoreductase subunit L
MIHLVWLIPLLPLIGFTVNGLLNKKIPKVVAGILASATLATAFAIAFGIFLEIKDLPGQVPAIKLFEFINVGVLQIPFSLLVDPLSILFVMIITGVGFLIHIYSIGYMHDDEGFVRFFAYLNLFVFFMLLLVLGSNYVIMFIGWEGVGLSSYLLIGFWYKNQNYNDAAKKAFIMNRVGDLGFLLAIFLIFVTFGSIEYRDVFAKAFSSAAIGSPVITIITLLLFVGAMGKSAQLPLYTWLPDAMAGPTPVSALIHAATMVTAGIYMIARSNILYTLSPITSSVVAVVGIATAIFAATIGLAQNDIKKVLAYSTVSQLGYMFLALGVGAYTGAIFHVMTHAFFKALLFLGAGSVIHAMSGEQDLRKMGGLKKALPITYFTFMIGTIAIAGIPPFSGFFSKDEILAHAFATSPILWALGVLGALMTAFYMFRLFFLTFFGNFRGTEDQKHHLHESPLTITIPLMVLAVLSVTAGYANFPEIFGGKHYLQTYLAPIFADSVSRAHSHHLDHNTELALMGISVFIVLISIAAAYSKYISKKAVPANEGVELSSLHKLVYNKYYVDEVYDALFVKPLYALSSFGHKFIELSGIDRIVTSFGQFTLLGGKVFSKLQTGHTTFYLFVMVLGMIAILTYNLLGKLLF